jgi:hypothetical protein
MIDVDTGVSILYVMVDDFCQSQQVAEVARPGPQAALSCSEVVTLAVFGQWAQFPSARAFYRYAHHHLRAAFPTLPDRSQFNRLQRQYAPVVAAFGLHVVRVLQAQDCLYECLDSSGIPTRDAKRRGTGWLAGQADIGWYEGVHLLVSIAKHGMISGFGFGSASTHDQRLLQTSLSARAYPTQQLASVGERAQGSISRTKASPGKSLMPSGELALERRSSLLPSKQSEVLA